MEEGIIKLDDVLMAELVEDVNFHGEVREFLVRLQLADLGGGEPAGLLVSSLVHLSKGTIAKLSDNLPELFRIHIVLDVLEDQLLLLLGLADVEHLLDAAEETHPDPLPQQHQEGAQHRPDG